MGGKQKAMTWTRKVVQVSAFSVPGWIQRLLEKSLVWDREAGTLLVKMTCVWKTGATR